MCNSVSSTFRPETVSAAVQQLIQDGKHNGSILMVIGGEIFPDVDTKGEYYGQQVMDSK